MLIMNVNKYDTIALRAFVAHPIIAEESNRSADVKFPRISIITPSYNQGSYLERTILSVLNQNYPNLEYIVIDGGSNDQSVAIIKKYERFLSYWISEKDSGQSDALNKGFSRATGEIIGWQNSDDVYLPGAFNKAVEAFRKFPGADVLFSNRLDIDASDNIIAETRFVPFSQITYWYDGMSLSNQSAFWKRTIFAQTGLLDCRFQLAMDYEFFLRVSLNNNKFKHVRDYFGAIRRHELTKTSTLFTTKIQAEHDLMDKLHGRNTRFNYLFKMYALCYRSLCYTLHGDFDYLARGIVRRLGL